MRIICLGLAFSLLVPFLAFSQKSDIWETSLNEHLRHAVIPLNINESINLDCVVTLFPNTDFENEKIGFSSCFDKLTNKKIESCIITLNLKRDPNDMYNFIPEIFALRIKDYSGQVIKDDITRKELLEIFKSMDYDLFTRCPNDFCNQPIIFTFKIWRKKK
ncbi:hypothetical protein FUAX_55300 (plasmid) [Fulvitalea axinellae]|uniref:Uncharacterized protein n=1 Tax=Fulvitalea axinellae TaxID=1182444 RepID=A0AAU9CYR8_9BACT|nr:hypothetical protein FUAX_55300 [Fulvitalea axinellae]